MLGLYLIASLKTYSASISLPFCVKTLPRFPNAKKLKRDISKYLYNAIELLSEFLNQLIFSRDLILYEKKIKEITTK